MLFINPHQPWYGYGQFYEAHVRERRRAALFRLVLLRLARADDGAQRAPGLGPHRQRAGHRRRLPRDVRRSGTTRSTTATGRSTARRPSGRTRSTSAKERPGRSSITTPSARRITGRVGRQNRMPGTLLAVKIARIFEGIRVRQALGMTQGEELRRVEGRHLACSVPADVQHGVRRRDGPDLLRLQRGHPDPRSAVRLDQAGRRQRSRAPSGRACIRSTICRKCSTPRPVTCRTATRRRS